jgi:high-affinity nickel-transport protein
MHFSQNVHTWRAADNSNPGFCVASVKSLFGWLVAANIAAWSWALSAFHDRPVLLGTAFLAWSLGLRHAVDADHIAAIDNVTRKLVQAGRRSLCVGLFFAVGHSAVVALAVALLAIAAPAMRSWLEQWRELGGLVGTLISALFLFAIATVNLAIFRSTWRTFRRAQDGTAAPDFAPTGGLLTRLARPLFALIAKPWHMMPLGFLFGLGFDTATEVALLFLAAGAASSGLPVYAILCLPVLFAAGMSLLDTIDGSFMNFAYGWAFSKPVRKVYYNLTITGLSIAVAFTVGSLELLSIAADRLRLHAGIWGWVSSVNLNLIGYFIAGLFVLTWALALVIWRIGRIEEKWAADAGSP